MRHDYDRIIVVGHSLGSVIGYDLIKHLWIKFNAQQRMAPHFSRDKITPLKEAATAETGVAKNAFWSAQRNLWEGQRDAAKLVNKIPWLISDFVTLGSPLAHARFLLGEGERDLNLRKVDRELPTCPPVKDPDKELLYFYEDPGFPVPHHAAPFVCVRWTNMYFPGDFVGGPLSKVFGDGIEDLPVRSGSLLDFTICSHTRYWKWSKQRRSSIEALQKHLVEGA